MKKYQFTLLEIIVSLGILLLILLIASMAVSGVYLSWSKISEREELMKQYRIIDRIVESAFRNAVPFHWKNRDNKEVVLFSGMQHSIFLTYLHRIDPSSQDGGIRFLKLYLQKGKLIAEYRPYPYLDQDSVNTPIKVEREILVDHIKTLDFVYLDYRDREIEPYDEWDCGIMKNIPMAIQMEIEFKSGKRQVWLRRTAGNSQYSEWGRRLKIQR